MTKTTTVLYGIEECRDEAEMKIFLRERGIVIDINEIKNFHLAGKKNNNKKDLTLNDLQKVVGGGRGQKRGRTPTQIETGDESTTYTPLTKKKKLEQTCTSVEDFSVSLEHDRDTENEKQATIPQPNCTSVYLNSSNSANGATVYIRSEDQVEKTEKTTMHEVVVYENLGRILTDKMTGGEFELPDKQCRFVACPNAKGEGNDDGGPYHAQAANVFGVTVNGTETIDVCPEFKLLDPLKPKGLTEAIMVAIVACQAKSAYDGVKVLAYYMNRYGSAEHNMVFIADQNERYVFEIYGGTTYAVKKLSKYDVGVFANQSSLGYIGLFKDSENIYLKESSESVASSYIPEGLKKIKESSESVISSDIPEEIKQIKESSESVVSSYIPEEIKQIKELSESVVSSDIPEEIEKTRESVSSDIPEEIEKTIESSESIVSSNLIKNLKQIMKLNLLRTNDKGEINLGESIGNKDNAFSPNSHGEQQYSSNLRVWYGQNMFGSTTDYSDYSDNKRVSSLFYTDKKITLVDLARFMASRYEGTVYGKKKGEDNDEGVYLLHEGNVGCYPIGNVGQSVVAMAIIFENLPSHAAVFFWVNFSNAIVSLYCPFSGRIKRVPDVYKVKKEEIENKSIEERSPEEFSVPYICKLISQMISKNRENLANGVQEHNLKILTNTEQRILKEIPTIKEQYEKSDDVGDEYVTKLAEEMAKELHQGLVSLYIELQTVYNHNMGVCPEERIDFKMPSQQIVISRN